MFFLYDNDDSDSGMLKTENSVEHVSPMLIPSVPVAVAVRDFYP